MVGFKAFSVLLMSFRVVVSARSGSVDSKSRWKFQQVSGFTTMMPFPFGHCGTRHEQRHGLPVVNLH